MHSGRGERRKVRGSEGRDRGKRERIVEWGVDALGEG